MTTLQYNTIFPDRCNFIVGSNLTNFFAIGAFIQKDDFYMIGWHGQDGRPHIDASVYASDGKLLFTLVKGHLDLTLKTCSWRKPPTIPLR